MFRKMRRKNQELAREEAIRILHARPTGILAVTGDDGYPYTVPLNYVFSDDKLFFHCAREGHKIDSIRKNDKVAFCVIENDEVVPKALATKYRSVVVFGRARILTDDIEKRHALERLIEKYSPGYREVGRQAIEKEWDLVSVVEIRIEHMMGKAAIKSVMEMEL
jgi:uncharacterized protein